MIEIKFEKLEKEIYRYICNMGKEITVKLLEEIDTKIFESRDKKRYKVKAKNRKTTIKTVYGEIEYCRRLYYDVENQRYIYLLDDNLQMERIGTISSNLAKRIADASINMSFRKAAQTISETTGQTISCHGAWNIVQQIGREIKNEEKKLVKDLRKERTSGTESAKVIFVEADGVHLKMQKQKKKAPSKELKLSTVYDGWVCEGKKLHNKKVFAGMEDAKIFNEKTEALVQSIYNTDMTQLRVVNGDGAGWIKNTYEGERIFQLDRFHILQEINRGISDRHIAGMIADKFYKNNIDGMLEDIQTYINSVDNIKEKKAKKLQKYLLNNYDGLLPWKLQAKWVPEPPEGITYKNMGTQENQNCSLVCMRMKGRKMRWSESGANNLAKLIYMKENGDLERIIEKADGILKIPEEIEAEKVFSADKICNKIGKGNKWIETIRATVPLIAGGKITPYSDLLRNLTR